MDITFEHILKMYYSQGAIYLGKINNPATNQNEKNLVQVKPLINILNILQEKTKNNLSEEENKLLIEILGFLKTNYNNEMN